ncbi:unnamed protein product [Ectocarpus sp. CCAP 1310/34]|nr:unnamed protein product [Ectocarpus sp. CCAP 1310/34]
MFLFRTRSSALLPKLMPRRQLRPQIYSSTKQARPTALAVATATAATAAAAAAAATVAVLTAWHREKPNEILVKNYDDFMRPTDGQKPGAAARVLVPLCGKTVDMPYLAQKGAPKLGSDPLM